jgi:hypothetical protein
MQAPHLMQIDWSISCGFFTMPLIALTGHLRAQAVQPMHLSGKILYSSKSLQTPAGHFLSTTWAMYSSLKNFIVESTGFGAV